MTGSSSIRSYFWLAWSLWALTVALMALTVVFTALYPLYRDPTSNAVNFAVAILFVATFQTVEALIASRRPENPIGWVFCAMGLTLVVAVFFGNYAQYSLVVDPGALPRAGTAAWVGNWIWLVALSPLGFFLLLFPDGRPPSPRWRIVARLQAAALAGWVVSQALAPGPLLNAGYESVDRGRRRGVKPATAEKRPRKGRHAMTEQAPRDETSSEEKRPREPRDAAYWARYAETLKVSGVAEGATNINVDGRRAVGPLQGFGKMWQKTYRVRLVGAEVSPVEVIETWKARYQDFWPEGNRFYAPLAGISPGEVALISGSLPGGVKLSTGVMVLYADDESFSLMTPQGHPFSG